MPQLVKGPADARQGREVERVRIAPHGHARDAKGKARTQALEKLICAGSSAGRVAQDADLVAAVNLAPGHVKDVAEQAPHRGAEDVQDAEAPLARHGRVLGQPDTGARPQRVVNVQNQRSLTTIVSPGFSG